MAEPTWTRDPDVWTKRFQAWGSMYVTTAILILLAYVIFITSRATDPQAFNGLIEIVKGMGMIAIGFWLGASNKDQQPGSTTAAPTPSITAIDARSGTATVTTGDAATPSTSTTEIRP